MIDLDALAHAASALDPLPASVTRLATMVCSDEPDLRLITEVVSYDQALTATLLRSANSSWSASRTPITTVKDAVVRLGASAVLSLALGACVRTPMQRGVPEYGLSEGDLWRHSVATALATEVIARTSPARVGAEAVTAGLLHDVGKLVMSRFLSDDVLALLHRAHLEGGCNRLEAEREILGVHHGELGALIAQSWELPDPIVRAISDHHTPALSGAPGAYAVALGDIVAKVIGAGLDDNPDIEGFAHCMEALALDADRFDAICRTVDDRFVEVAERYS